MSGHSRASTVVHTPRVDLTKWRWATWKPLRGAIAVVAGGTRGAGRAISVCLGTAGAFVYVTGRSTQGHPATPGRPETIEETAAMIAAQGGKAIAVRVDHTVESDVRRLFARVKRENRGRLDILVNDVWGGEELTEWGVPPWELDWGKGRRLLERAVFSHILTSRYGVPLMIPRRRGLVVEVTDGASDYYRGSLFYDLVKTSVVRLAFDYAEEFREANLQRLAAVAVTPGFLRSEFMLEQFGVTESNWKQAETGHTGWLHSETPYFLGQAVAHLAGDPKIARRSGRVFGSWTLARDYGIRDLNGTRPNWGALMRKRLREVQ